MKNKVIALFINGEMFLIHNDNYTREQENALKNFAKMVLSDHPELTDFSDKEIFDWFIRSASKKLSFNLIPVEISFVLGVT